MALRLKKSTTVVIALATALASACSMETRDVDLGQQPPPAFVAPDATPVDASGAETNATVELCIATECPAPYTTCSVGHKCGTNVSNDPENCGTCGNVCPSISEIEIKAKCVGGKCRYECDDENHIDCNGLPEDGCEVNFKTDPENCGVCGNKCAPGVGCYLGQCGCPGGFTNCNGRCVNLQNDDRNCRECGNVCPSWQPGSSLPEPPPNMDYGCAGAECDHLKCYREYRDCDGNQPNGCETNVAEDPNNCSDCGIQCAPGQICSIPVGAKVPKCLCAPGETLCGGDGEEYECIDLLNNFANCGACDNSCISLVNGLPHMTAACEQGRCRGKCIPGFADCDGDPMNGCEVSLRNDASNCGACGNWCSASQGQPCIEGACLVQECDGGAAGTR